VDLSTYAELAVRLVNAAHPDQGRGRDSGDELATVESFRSLVADRPGLAGRVTAGDLLTRHDGRRWHMHLVDSGSVADRYAAGAIAGLTGLIAESGTRRLGVCAAPGCERVFAGNGAGRDKRYCSVQCTPEASVRTLRAGGGGQGAPTAAS
jgi:predicted RNA-binding Zn ribbon-like protein